MVEPAIKSFPPIYDALKDKQKKKVVVIAHSQGTIIMSSVLRWLTLVARPRVKMRVPPLDIPKRLKNTVAVAPEQFYTPSEPVFVYPDDAKLRFQDFETLSEAEFAKLEVYCFANCAKSMTYFKPPENGRAPIPFIENFANEKDIVARLGMLAPRPERWGITVAGPYYVHKGAWGHLLNEHHLSGIQKFQKSGRAQGGAGSALPFKLINTLDYPADSVPRLYSYINGGQPSD